MGPEDESRNTRDRTGHRDMNRTSSEAKKDRCPWRPTIHTQPGHRYSKGPNWSRQKCENGLEIREAGASGKGSCFNAPRD